MGHRDWQSDPNSRMADGEARSAPSSTTSTTPHVTRGCCDDRMSSPCPRGTHTSLGRPVTRFRPRSTHLEVTSCTPHTHPRGRPQNVPKLWWPLLTEQSIGLTRPAWPTSGRTMRPEQERKTTMKIRHRITRARTTLKRQGTDAGMTTAEYSVGTLAPCR